MSNNNDYTTGNLLDFGYFKKNYRLIGIDLSKQTKLKDPQQISFISKLLNRHEATMFIIIEKSEETTFNFLQNCVTIIQIMETQKTVNFLNGSDNENSKFATRKWYVIDSESKGNCPHENPVKFLTSSLESNLCDYSNAYILVTGNIAVTRTIVGVTVADNPQRKQPLNAATRVVFKNCAPFKHCTTEIMTVLLIMQILLILQCLCTFN